MSEQEQGNIPPKATPAATPGAPRPITVRLKPITPPAAPGAPAATPPPPAAAPAATSADPGTTVKLTPVVLTPVAAPAPVTPPAPVAPPASPSATSAIPATSAQVQASKSKTSRISLDSAIGVPTSIPIKASEGSGPKTIRLKRPSDLSAPMTPVAPVTPPTAKSGTAPIRQTSRIPDSILPTDVSLDTSTVTQKKTLKIKRPGADAAPEAESADTSMDGIQMLPITSDGIEEGSKGFTIAAVVLGSIAAVLMVALTLCVASDALGPASSNTGKMTADVFWPGKFVQ